MNKKIIDIKQEIQNVVVGHTELVDSLLIGLISDGHILVEGVPGLAKTTAINAIAASLAIEFKRIQFTPDLLPSDITGTIDDSFSIEGTLTLHQSYSSFQFNNDGELYLFRNNSIARIK